MGVSVCEEGRGRGDGKIRETEKEKEREREREEGRKEGVRGTVREHQED